jgi:hypothetical protein
MLKTIPYYYLPIDEFIIHSQLFKLKEHFKQLITLENKRYKTSYLNFNRRWRMHRFLFVSLLVSHKIVNRGLVSLGDTKEYPTNKLEFYQSLMNEKFLDNETKTILNDNKDQILNMSDLHVDDMDLSKPELCVSLHSTENSHFPYKETYVSVISETLFFEDLPLRYTKDVGRFVTEKTFKAIAHKHPFILIAPYKTLSLMKTLGYKTFSPFIDESYDDIENDMERMKYILKEVQRLDSLNEDELANFIKNLIPIAEYNFNLLLNKQLGEFITRIG